MEEKGAVEYSVLLESNFPSFVSLAREIIASSGIRYEAKRKQLKIARKRINEVDTQVIA